VDRPLTGFCNEFLLGAKYAVCQEILTEKSAAGQETLIKTLLPQKEPMLKGIKHAQEYRSDACSRLLNSVMHNGG